MYLRNTKYDENEAISTLALLDSIDKEKYNEPLELEELFDSPEYPFKDSWIAKEQSLFDFAKGDEDEFHEDSLKTHPDCSKRIALLKPSIEKNTKEGARIFLQQESEFQELVRLSDFELLESELTLGNYGYCLFQSIKFLKHHPNNVYLYAMINQCIYLIHKAQQEHSMGKYVRLASQVEDEDYKQLNTFLHRLRLSEMAKVGYFFAQKHKKQFAADEYFLYTLWLSSKMMEKPEEASAYQREYVDKFPKGRFVKNGKLIEMELD